MQLGLILASVTRKWPSLEDCFTHETLSVLIPVKRVPGVSPVLDPYAISGNNALRFETISQYNGLSRRHVHMGTSDSNLDRAFSRGSEMSGVVEDTTFQILVLGNWTGGGGESWRPLPDRRPIEIDRDNFDEVMEGLDVRLRVEVGGSEMELVFRSIDDFTPDALYENVAAFAELKSFRKRLRDPNTFREAAREFRGPDQPEVGPASRPVSGESLLDNILSAPEGGAPIREQRVSSDLSRLSKTLYGRTWSPLTRTSSSISSPPWTRRQAR
jgi:hypothetical protein